MTTANFLQQSADLYHWYCGTVCLNLVISRYSVRPMCRGSAADPGLTPELGPFAVCHSPSLSLPVSCHIFSCSINKAIKGQKNI